MSPDIVQFLATLAAAVRLYYPEGNEPIPEVPLSGVKESYDFIIVGAGTAGCVLANRLTENPEWKVLLIEAGGDEDDVDNVPFFSDFFDNTNKDWNYTSVKQTQACLSQDGICSIIQGLGMGGSSSIHSLSYSRGGKVDYDEWKRMWNHGWSYDDVLPYFIKAENVTEIPAPSNVGTCGPLQIQYSKYTTKMRDEYIKAGKEIGFRFGNGSFGEDYNNLIDLVHNTLDGRSRLSNSKAYLGPIKNRTNLHLIKESIVKKIIIENKVAIGVEYCRGENEYKAFAGREVILAAGALNSPKILMLSGLGPKDILEKHNINLINDLPVGKILYDHPSLPLFFELDKTADIIRTDLWRTNRSIMEYAKEGRGPLTTLGFEATAFFNPYEKGERKDPPSVQFMFFSSAQTLANIGTKHIIRCLVSIVHPCSIGNIKLKSNNYTDQPLIDLNFYGNEVDKITMEKSIEKLLEFMRTPTMSKYSPKIYKQAYSACQEKTESEFIKCIIPQYTISISHPVGTVKMGSKNDPESVIYSTNLTIRGVERLRVIDASVMPQTPRSSTLAATTMIAEYGADLIKHYYKSKHNRTRRYSTSTLANSYDKVSNQPADLCNNSISTEQEQVDTGAYISDSLSTEHPPYENVSDDSDDCSPSTEQEQNTDTHHSNYHSTSPSTPQQPSNTGSGVKPSKPHLFQIFLNYIKKKFKQHES